MLLPVREEADLESPPEPFYTNSSECINNVLKVKVDCKCTELKKLNEMPITAVDHVSSTSHSVMTADIASLTDDPPELPSTAASSSAASVQRCLQPVSQPVQADMLSTKLASISDKLGLPTTVIDGIAKKAADILSTDGAIVQASGHSAEAKMVISRSGKRPHLVLPKRKSGGLTCDEDCPQYILVSKTMLAHCCCCKVQQTTGPIHCLIR